MRLFILNFFLYINTLINSQTKNINIDYLTNIGLGKKMTGVNTGPNSIVSGTTTVCLQNIGNELIRTHDYHGPCDYWGYTNFFNYFNQSFNYNFQSHIQSNYDWSSTDAQISKIIDANMQPFFRLGISFPGGGVSPASPMPKDIDGINFTKFAGICKRTAMHYTDSWNNGYQYIIPYWEIWNEPNNNASWTVDSVSAYYRMFKQCVDSIKSFNPLLKVGGPGTAKNAFFNGGVVYTINQNYVSNFFNFCQSNSVPLDFYSFHMYDRPNPYNLRILTDTLTYYLNQYGFSNTELIITETNINKGGYLNTSKGCSYLTSELISIANSRLSKFIWYRGIDLNPLCNSDISGEPSLQLNGYAYKFFNELNEITPIFIKSIGNEFNKNNLNDSLNNLMILSGKNNSDIVKILISNHESIYNNFNIEIDNLDWSLNDSVSILTEIVDNNGYNTNNSIVIFNNPLVLNIPNISDESVYYITLTKKSTTSINTLNSNVISIYPNPAFDKVNILTSLKDYNLILYNSLGVKIIDQKNISEIDLFNISNGIYLIRLEDENRKTYNYKLLVNKN